MGKLLREERLRGIHPQLVLLAKSWTVQLSFNIEVLSGIRTNAQQAQLYAQGRTAPGRIVTQASTAVLSPHGRRFFSGNAWGCAFDAMPLDEEGNIQWYPSGHPREGQPTPEGLGRLRMMAIYAERQGVVWGGSWTSFPDLDHFQLMGWKDAPPAPDTAPAPPADERVVASEADFSDVTGGSSTAPATSPPEDGSS